jgi:hypothetical protein
LKVVSTVESKIQFRMNMDRNPVFHYRVTNNSSRSRLKGEG